MGRTYGRTVVFASWAMLALSCGGGGGGAMDGGGDAPPPGPFAVEVIVSGLAGTVVLRNNGGDDLTIDENGTFSFATELANGSSYLVSVETQPLGSTCTVPDGSGTIAGSTPSVTVTCAYDGDYWTVGSMTFAEATSGVAPDGYDPSVSALYHATRIPPYIYLSAGSGWNGTLGEYLEFAGAFLFPNPLIEGTYAISTADDPGNAVIWIGSQTVSDVTRKCDATAGTLTITHDGGELAPMLATFTVTACTSISLRRATPAEAPTTSARERSSRIRATRRRASRPSPAMAA